MGRRNVHSIFEHRWFLGRTPQNKTLPIRQVMVFTPLPAGAGIARSARPTRAIAGLQPANATCCRSPTRMWCFTLPHQFGPLALRNKRALFDLLFRASAETLLEVARDPRLLGADIGFFSVLHS